MSSDFRNNLTVGDDNTLLARLGLMTFTTNSTASSVQINIRNQISSTASNTPPFTPSYQNIWSSVTQYATASGGTPTAQALRSAQTFFNSAYNSSQVCRSNYAVLITDGEDTMGGLDGASGNGSGVDYYHNGNFYPNGYSVNVGQVARNNAVIQEAANLLTNNPSVKVFTVGVGISDTTADKNVLREVLEGPPSKLTLSLTAPLIPPLARRGTIPRGARGGPSSPRTRRASRAHCALPSIR